jgi:radical SAM protein with 4Fe4S-binding SPASM domain
MCGRSYWDEDIFPLGDMSMETFNKLIPLIKKASMVNLSMVGEAFLNPHWFEMARTCKSYGCHVLLYSNGTLIDESIAEGLVSNQIDEIYISIDSPDPKELSRIRRGANLEKIIRGIQLINAYKKKLNSSKPDIIINVVPFKDTIPKLPELVELAGSLGIKRVALTNLIAHARELADQRIMKYPDLARRYFLVSKKRAEELGVSISFPPLQERRRNCPYAFSSIWINWEGEVLPCDFVSEKVGNALRFGNINDFNVDIQEIWNCVGYIELRKGILREGRLPHLCKVCPITHNSLKNTIRLLEK